MSVEFYDGSSFNATFTYDHYINNICSNDYSSGTGDWNIEDNTPKFSMNVYQASCITGSGGATDLQVDAVKL